MAIHQLLSYARRGDAVTHQALALRDALGGRGTSHLLAHGSDDTVAGDVVPLDAVDQLSISDDDLVVYHVTIGCEPAVRWLLGRNGPFGLVHHNITPSRFFENLSWEHARLTEQGRNELAELVPGAEVVVADSMFNAAEIAALRGTVHAIHPPIDSTRRLAGIPNDPRLARQLRGQERPNFVQIGQVLPHKRQHEAVTAVHALVHHLGTDADLTLIGAAPVPAYEGVVDGLVATRLPGRCRTTGLVSDRELATRLRHSTALVSMSEHEGYCVPIVEAMAMGTPVVASDAGAVAETAGGAALLLPVDAPPTLVAEALHALATDEVLRADLRRRGRQRADEIEAEIDLDGLARTLALTTHQP